MKKIIAFERRSKKNVKKSQKNIGYIVAIVLLSIALLGTNLLSFLGIWRNLIPAVEPMFVLGRQANFEIELNSSSSIAFEFKGSAVNDTYYNQPIFAEMPVTENQYVLRAKAVVNTGQYNAFAQIASDSNWMQGQDGYYYFTMYALGGEKICLSNGIVLPKLNTLQDKTYSLIVTVESLQTSEDFQNIWQLPQDFKIVNIVQD